MSPNKCYLSPRSIHCPRRGVTAGDGVVGGFSAAGRFLSERPAPAPILLAPSRLPLGHRVSLRLYPPGRIGSVTGHSATRPRLGRFLLFPHSEEERAHYTAPTARPARPAARQELTPLKEQNHTRTMPTTN